MTKQEAVAWGLIWCYLLLIWLVLWSEERKR